MGRNSLAVVREIDAQIHEVVLSPAGFIHNSLQHGLIDLVGDVAKHDLRNVSLPHCFHEPNTPQTYRCSYIYALADARYIDMIMMAGNAVEG
jgi:hypothetical protein